jgi:hypothetical protein
MSLEDFGNGEFGTADFGTADFEPAESRTERGFTTCESLLRD